MAELVVPSPSMTFEDVAQLDPESFRGDLVRGEWIPVSRNTWRHGEIVGNAYALLRQYARAQGGWRVSVGDPGTRLAQDPDTLRGPDVAVVPEGRQPAGHGVDGWLDGAPDLAVEVVGDRQTSSQLARKALEYLSAGGRMVWVIDPEAQLVLVLTAPNQLRILGLEDTLDGAEVLPGFGCAVAAFFE